MDENRESLVEGYVRHAINTAEDRLGKMTRYPSGEVAPERYVLKMVKKSLDDFSAGERARRWIILPGLRGMGKTTMLAQSYSHLRNQNIPRNRVLYLSMDDLGRKLNVSLDDAMSAYERIIGKNLERLDRDDALFLLVDEAHNDPHWDGALKSVFDRTDSVFILVTGSSALALSHGADAARRAVVKRVPPLSFTEFMMMSGGPSMQPDLMTSLRAAIFNSGSAVEVYSRLQDLAPRISSYLADVRPYAIDDYLLRGCMAFALAIEDQVEVFDSASSIMDKIISVDLPAIKAITPATQVKAWNLLTTIAVADRVSLETLGRDLELTKTSVISIIDALEKAEVIFRVRPFGSEATRVRKTPKFKFTAASMRAALLWKIGKDLDGGRMGMLFEDAVAQYLHLLQNDLRGMRSDYDHEDGGADFVLQFPSSAPIVLEAGVGRKGKEQLHQTSRKVGPRYSLLVADKTLRLDEEMNIVTIPREYFLMVA
jgi:predicted AAA+ superfamily ATPase